MTKIKFCEVPIGEPFVYNDILYVKTKEDEGASQRLGPFTFHANEIVEIAYPVERDPLKGSALRWLLVYSVIFGTLYLIGEFCL
ncbi:MAG TPA: hypothetical protein PK079_24015 [Leptospiraceae bacterium]|nr:hypothetical protein [Leptospiraceae bacterium]HMW08567.1 hypothetical protein [Leptospiraceae bacterium]HMZ66490.1 hypothetical protein [Leptospiraceae bacterium]HNA10032.1 hypothetical protein [Leptospiraceae bacterium]HNC00249.1 hypothetical protein [Leptospiraceae bacterium]